MNLQGRNLTVTALTSLTVSLQFFNTCSRLSSMLGDILCLPWRAWRDMDSCKMASKSRHVPQTKGAKVLMSNVILQVEQGESNWRRIGNWWQWFQSPHRSVPWLFSTHVMLWFILLNPNHQLRPFILLSYYPSRRLSTTNDYSPGMAAIELPYILFMTQVLKRSTAHSLEAIDCTLHHTYSTIL